MPSFAVSALMPLLWHSLAGVGIIGACVLVIIFAIPQLRFPAIVVAASVALALGVYWYGEYSGATRKQAEWTHAEQRTVEIGKKARRDAVRSVDRPKHTWRLRKPAHDPYNRDAG